VNERFGYIKAEKSGYIHGSRSVVPTSGINKVTIMLLEATIAGSVNSGSAESVTANDGSSLSFDGNFVKEEGAERMLQTLGMLAVELIGSGGLLSFSVEKEGYKNEEISISPKDSSSTVNITLYKTSSLNLARFSKTNYNLPALVENNNDKQKSLLN